MQIQSLFEPIASLAFHDDPVVKKFLRQHRPLFGCSVMGAERKRSNTDED